MTRPGRVDGRAPGATRETPAKSGPQRGRTAAVNGPSNGRGPVATRGAAATEPFLRLLVVVPAVVSGLDRSAVSSDNPAMDPVIAALAQLVRDRYERELAEKAAIRQRLRVVEGKSV
jgi:hypothetical protein